MNYVQLFLIAALTIESLSNQAEAAAPRRVTKFEELKKITVGPFDNFQTAIADGSNELYFTRSQNLSTQIMRFDLKNSQIAPVTGAESDAKSPAVSPDGKKIAMTYYRNDAKGDVCILEVKDLKCLTGPGLGEHSPLWISNERLAYVQSNDTGTKSKLIIQDLQSKKTEVLIEGEIYGPAVSRKGDQIVYKTSVSEFLLFDVGSRSVKTRLQVSLPGASGSASFSSNGDYIYFSQYMIDSNRDLLLDSRDTSAIFRMKTDGKNIAPEQLTSLEQNCSFPTPAKEKLYMTCAFEGALDVYSTSLSGIVPAVWEVSDLWEAHRAARSYSDRILILNQIYARMGRLSKEDYSERVFANFVLMNAWIPATYYAELLKTNDKKYAVHVGLLETVSRWEAMPSKENIAELRRMLEIQEKKLRTLPDSDLQQVALAYIDYFGHKESEAMRRAQSITSSDAMTLYWQTKLFERILGGKTDQSYDRILENRMANHELNEETRFYYLSRWLTRLEADKNREQRFKGLVDVLQAQKSDPVSLRLIELLDNEAQLYRAANGKTKIETRDEIRGVVDRVKRLKSDYFALRLLFARGMVIFYQQGKTRELATFMSLWLSYISPDSKEYPYAIEALRKNSLDVAYKFYNGPRETKDFAIGSFFDSIRTTDDLESHFQYTLLNSTPSAWQDLLKSYTTMRRDGLIQQESFEFVKALHKISSAKEKPSNDDLAKATSTVESISDDHTGVGVKYLYLGYLYHRQLLDSVKGFAFDRDLAEKAHRSYLYAIDAAWNNERIQAAAFQNLGILHSLLRNFSMSAEFFQKRHEMGFESNEHRQAAYWLEARSLYQSYRAGDAVRVIEEALATNPANKDAFLEKQAFYAWNARDFAKSAKIYSDVLPRLKSKAKSGTYLSYGYALMKSGQTAQAESAFKEAIKLSREEKSFEAYGLKRTPKKIEFAAKGLLAHLPISASEKIQHLNDRLEMFDEMISDAKDLYLDPKTLRAQRVKESFDLVMLLVEPKATIKDPSDSKEFKKALNLALDFANEHGYLNQTIFASLKNSMILMRKGQVSDDQDRRKLIADLVKGAEKELKEEKNPSSNLRQQWGQVQLVDLAFRLGATPDLAKRFAAESEKLLQSTNFTELAADRPDMFTEIKSYRNNLARTL